MKYHLLIPLITLSLFFYSCGIDKYVWFNSVPGKDMNYASYEPFYQDSVIFCSATPSIGKTYWQNAVYMEFLKKNATSILFQDLKLSFSLPRSKDTISLNWSFDHYKTAGYIYNHDSVSYAEEEYSCSFDNLSLSKKLLDKEIRWRRYIYILSKPGPDLINETGDSKELLLTVSLNILATINKEEHPLHINRTITFYKRTETDFWMFRHPRRHHHGILLSRK